MSYSTSITLGTIFMVFGLWLKVYPPKQINHIFGYRSPLSKSSKEAWIEGNKFSGKLLLVGGVIIMILTLICKYTLPDNTTVMAALQIIEVVIMIGSIIWTEIHLKNYINKHGKNNKPMM